MSLSRLQHNGVSVWQGEALSLFLRHFEYGRHASRDLKYLRGMVCYNSRVGG